MAQTATATAEVGARKSDGQQKGKSGGKGIADKHVKTGRASTLAYFVEQQLSLRTWLL